QAEPSTRRVDVLVVGGGVVGCAILRELCRYDAEAALVEARPDLGDGTSKANSAIVHTGFDAPPGSLEARLLAESRELWPEVVADLHVPYLPTGALMAATDAGQLATLREQILPKAARNGVPVEELARAEVLAGAPYLTEDAVGGALIAGEGVIDPFWLVRAYAESALRNGAAVTRGAAVTAVA